MLTREDVKSALKDVLTDHEALSHLIAPVVTKVVDDILPDYLELSLGITPTEKGREEAREDMQAVRKTRVWAHSHEGKEEIKAMREMAEIYTATRSRVFNVMTWIIIGGSVIIATVGITHADSWLRYVSPYQSMSTH